MITKTEKTNKKIYLNKLPCRSCINYLTRDDKSQPASEFKSKMEILYYLEHIKDPKVNKMILNLLKNIACQ